MRRRQYANFTFAAATFAQGAADVNLQMGRLAAGERVAMDAARGVAVSSATIAGSDSATA